MPGKRKAGRLKEVKVVPARELTSEQIRNSPLRMQKEDKVPRYREDEIVVSSTTKRKSSFEEGQPNASQMEQAETRWWLPVGVGDYWIRALIDHGASRTVMGKVGLTLVTACGRTLEPSDGKGALVADGRQSPIAGYATLPLEVAGLTKEIRVAIMPELAADCYLGTNFIRQFGAVLDPDTNELLIKRNGKKVALEIAAMKEVNVTTVSSIGIMEATTAQQAQLESLLNEMLPKEGSPLGCTDWIQHEVNVGDIRPIKQRYYPVSQKIEEEMHNQVKDMLEAGIIEPSTSGWSSPIVMVKKPNGTLRFCIDFRKVNAVTRPDAYPLPYMDNILRKLQRARYISTLDLSSAYHQIPMKKESKPITAFTVPGMGLYQFRRMPFGLSYAGATFQRLIDMVIGPEMEPVAFSYLDDIIIVTETFEEHLKWLEHVLTRVKLAGLTVNREKSEFCRPEVKYLGVLVNRDGFRPDPKRIEPIIEYPAPRNLKQLRRFLGMASWYRKFLKDFATLSEPLTRLTKKDRKYDWLEEQENAFEQIKALVATAPVLSRPNFNVQFVVQTDASDTGIGAVLLQFIDDEEKVLEFASRTLSQAERNYSVTERECLAVIWAIQKFRPYIDGYHFRVITDHSSLRWLKSLNSPTGRLARWALELQGHMFDVEHRKGALNHVPDALSRMHEDEEVQISAITWAEETKDPWYMRQVKRVRSNPAAYPRWKLIGGQLYTYRPDPGTDETLGDDDAWKIVVPQEKQDKILKECHDIPTSGHLGREKTFAKVVQYYYWPGHYKAVREYVRKCLVCQQIKVEQKPPAGLMGKRTIDRPWQVVSADVTGPLSKSKNGYEYILTFQDLFTRWAECIPIRKANGKTILKHLHERIILRFGTPEVFLSDNGSEFKNHWLDDYLTKQGVLHANTPPYHPQANPVERINRTLKTRIIAYVEENHRLWDEHLPELMFSLNNSQHSSLGTTPAMLNYGRNPTPPGLTRRGQDRATLEKEEQENVKTWEERMKNLPRLHRIVAAKASEEQDRQAIYYDAKHRDVSYKVGDLVWKKNRVLSSGAHGFSAKLAPKYVGPYLVTSQPGSNTYNLLDPEGGTEDMVHIENLKSYVPGNGTGSPTASEDEAESEEEKQLPADPEPIDLEIGKEKKSIIVPPNSLNQTGKISEDEGYAQPPRDASVSRREPSPKRANSPSSESERAKTPARVEPKRRGRPRKNACEMAPASAIIANKSVTIAKRPRGRPKMKSAVGRPAKKVVVTETRAKRPRGRPKKIRSE